MVMGHDGLWSRLCSGAYPRLLDAGYRFRRLGFAAILIALLGWSPAMSAPRTIQLRADAWCPYNCEPSDPHPGLMIEIIKAALEPHGYVIDYKVMPWERALSEARNGNVDGVIGVSQAEAAGLITHEHPAGVATLVMVTRKDNTIRYSGVSSLDSLRVGAIEGYSYSGEVDAWIEANLKNRQRLEFVHGATPLELNIRKLIAGRIDVFPETKEVAWLRLRDLGLLDQVIFQDANSVEPIYFGFSPRRPDLVEVARLIDAGIVDLRRTGQLQSIIQFYGVQDWGK